MASGRKRGNAILDDYKSTTEIYLEFHDRRTRERTTKAPASEQRALVKSASSFTEKSPPVSRVHEWFVKLKRLS